MKSVNSVISYAKKNYITTFVLIILLILLVRYLQQHSIYENYVSMADAKNKNVPVSFTAKNNVQLSNICLVYKVNADVVRNINTYTISSPMVQINLNTPTQITGTSGDAGWAIGVTGSTNKNGNFDYNTTFTFDKQVRLDNAESIGSSEITISQIQNSNNVKIHNITKKDASGKIIGYQTNVVLKMTNVKAGQVFISLKFV